MPEAVDGKVVVSKGLEVSEPGVDASYPVDLALEGNKFPRETYEAENALDLSIEGDQS